MNSTVSTASPRPSKRRALQKLGTLFTVGGVGYYAMEMAWRGRSHWSMALCGGVCLCAIYYTNRRLRRKSIVLRALLGSVIITAAELLCGCFVNLKMHWGVWDYSALPLNLWGQICLPFSLLWAALCLPVCAVCSRIDKSSKP